MGDYEKLADYTGLHGFRLVQVSLDNPRYFPERFDRDRREEVRRLFSERGIGLCFHGPSDIPLMNRHEKVRLAGLERVCEMIDMAIDMGAEYFIFHPGRLAFYSMSTKRVFFMEQRHPERVIELLSNSLERLLAHCGDGIKLCLENTHAVSTPLLKMLSRLASENGLSLVWDVVHAEQLPQARRSQLIRFFQDNIKHVKLGHLHDIREDADHKSLGSGRLDVAAYLEIFNTMGIDIILEIFPESELLSSLEYVKNIAISDKTG